MLVYSTLKPLDFKMVILLNSLYSIQEGALLYLKTQSKFLEPNFSKELQISRLELEPD